MNETATVLNAVVPVFGIVAIGLVVRKLGWFSEQADQSVIRVVVNLLLPCLILDSTLGNPALSKASNLLLAPTIGYVLVAVGIFLSFIARPLHGLEESSKRRTFAVCAGVYNYGYVPLPLAQMLFDKETTGVLFLHIIGVEVAMWTLCVLVLSGGSGRIEWRKIINGPVIAIAIAVLLNALGWNSHITTPVLTTMHWLGQCAIPIALIVIGAVMADHLNEFQSAHGWRVISSSVLLRIGFLPLLLVAAARWIPMSIELKRVLVLEAAMPAAVFPIVLSKHYDGDPPTAMRVVLATTVVSLVTIPLWIRFGLRFVGL